MSTELQPFDLAQLREIPLLAWHELPYVTTVSSTDLAYCLAMMMKDLARGNFGPRFYERRYSHLDPSVRIALVGYATQLIIDETYPKDPDVAAAAHVADMTSLIDTLREMLDEMTGDSSYKGIKLRTQIVSACHKLICERTDFLQKLGKIASGAPAVRQLLDKVARACHDASRPEHLLERLSRRCGQ